jgi:hypothetical protein
MLVRADLQQQVQLLGEERVIVLESKPKQRKRLAISGRNRRGSPPMIATESACIKSGE